MKLTPHPFRADIVEFTWVDLLKLMIGRQLKDGGLIARRASNAK